MEKCSLWVGWLVDWHRRFDNKNSFVDFNNAYMDMWVHKSLVIVSMKIKLFGRWGRIWGKTKCVRHSRIALHIKKYDPVGERIFLKCSMKKCTNKTVIFPCKYWACTLNSEKEWRCATLQVQRSKLTDWLKTNVWKIIKLRFRYFYRPFFLMSAYKQLWPRYTNPLKESQCTMHRQHVLLRLVFTHSIHSSLSS